MRKTRIISLIIIAAILGYALWRDVAGSEVRLVAFGDSLVAGTGSTDGGFVPLLAERINQPIENLGVPGNTTADALARIDAALAERPDIAIILLGGNDYFQGVPRTETGTNLGRIIDAFRGVGARVLLIGLSTPGGSTTDTAFFASLAEAHGAELVPDALAGIYGNPALMSRDGVHPNDQGYARLAERIYPVLRKLIN
jgi:acyl-CoA thioesterase-1